MDMELTLKNYRCFSEERPAKFVLRPGFTSIVGANNSGKSSLLRFFYELRPLFRALNAHANLHNAIHQPTGLEVAASVLDLEELFSNRNEHDIELTFRVRPNEATLPRAGFELPDRLTVTISRNRTFQVTVFRNEGPLKPSDGGVSIDVGARVLTQGGRTTLDLAAYFEVWNAMQNAIYIGPFRNAINVGSNEQYYDIQTGQAFVRKWKDIKLGNVKRSNDAAVRLTDDIRRLFAFESLEISPSADDTSLQVYVDGKSYRLAELGSGITQFIIVLANAAMTRPSFVLIDEPEMSLHPSLQLDFITTLASYATQGVVFATHSVGLARSASEFVYSMRSATRGISEVTDYAATASLSEFLGTLSFPAYRELGYNGVVLVEGPTELATIQQLLRLYNKDHKVVLLSLAGASGINATSANQLEEIKRLTTNIHAVIDSERDSSDAHLSPGRQGFTDACRAANIPCLVLRCRALENYFPESAIKKAKGSAYKSLGPYESLKRAASPWSKSENWKIAREMTVVDLKETDLGNFLESL